LYESEIGVIMASFTQSLISCLALSCSAAMMNLSAAAPAGVLECQKLLLKGPDGRVCIILDATDSKPTISFIDSKGKANLFLTGGDSPTLILKNKTDQEVITVSLDKDQTPQIIMKDKKNLTRMQIQGGDSPAIFIKNGQNEVVATMLLLQDGGAAVGLADKDGDVAAFMRGGTSPSVSFFQKSVEPTAAVGISQNVPHMVLSSPTTKDNIVLHGGDPTSVLFVDEQGDVPILLSKQGLFQAKKESSNQEEKKEGKIFTKEDLLNPLKDKKLNVR